MLLFRWKLAMQMMTNKIQENGVVIASPPHCPCRRSTVHMLTKHQKNQGKWNPYMRKFQECKTLYAVHPCSVCRKTTYYIVHVTLDMTSAGFALESICMSTVVEIALVLINSSDFWCFWGSMFVSLALPHCFQSRFLHHS